MAQLISDLQNASRLAQAGRLGEAESIYRKVLSVEPNHAEATHFLGVCLVRSGRRGEGLPLLARSLELAPANLLYRQNYGLLLAQSGELRAAETQFLEILRTQSANATAHNYLGMVRQRLGRFDEACACYEEALRLAPADAAAASNLGYCLLERGDIDGAERALRRSLQADPANPEAHNHLGNALRMRGELQAALASYRRAIEVAPRFATAHYNVAMVLRDLHDGDGALQAVRTAVHCAPDHPALWQLFVELIAASRFSAWNSALVEDCERLFSQTEVEVQDAAEAILSLVRLGPRGRLFLLLLEHAVVADEAFEREMTALRRELLAAPASLELCCALAQQCFLNEYIWPESEDETAELSRLQPKSALEIAVLAMYRPIGGLQKPARAGPAFERMWRRLVEEPEQEAAIDVPAVTEIKDAVSREVQAQYENNPYPRWHRAPAAAGFPLPRMLRSLFPELDRQKLAAPQAPDVLIAGCGTGRHAAVTAQLQPHGRILAVDLSRASLAYAMRRARELGLANIRFAQADILQLGALEERFDLIECSGVLHHMRDPMQGWRVLLSLLRPGGFMKLGLYSELARRATVAAREVVRDLPVAAARRRILDLPPEHPARRVTRLRDFYSASGARDLILHVQEHRFTIPQLASCMAELGVEFLGFELSGKRLAMPLEAWDAYETAHPDTFASMYQFWIRRPS